MGMKSTKEKLKELTQMTEEFRGYDLEFSNLTPAAERKRQQRARAAAGQVHRVAVYLTDHELERAVSLGQGNPANGLIAALATTNA